MTSCPFVLKVVLSLETSCHLKKKRYFKLLKGHDSRLVMKTCSLTEAVAYDLFTCLIRNVSDSRIVYHFAEKKECFIGDNQNSIHFTRKWLLYLSVFFISFYSITFNFLPIVFLIKLLFTDMFIQKQSHLRRRENENSRDTKAPVQSDFNPNQKPA